VTSPLEDDVDRTLVGLLASDGRATLATLAAAAGLSVSATQARVRRLEQRGVIRGYSADVDPEALGLPLAAFVAITPLDPAQPDDAPERLAELPAVEACYSVAGDESYLLLVRVPSPRKLEELLRQIRAVANVRTRTTVVLQTFYENRPGSANRS
jgi:Lrp/AsnC family leucine-responsive transcriptional regulator